MGAELMGGVQHTTRCIERQGLWRVSGEQSARIAERLGPGNELERRVVERHLARIRGATTSRPARNSTVPGRARRVGLATVSSEGWGPHAMTSRIGLAWSNSRRWRPDRGPRQSDHTSPSAGTTNGREPLARGPRAYRPLYLLRSLPDLGIRVVDADLGGLVPLHLHVELERLPDEVGRTLVRVLDGLRVLLAIEGVRAAVDEYLPDPRRESSLGWMLVRQGFDGSALSRAARGPDDNLTDRDVDGLLDRVADHVFGGLERNTAGAGGGHPARR